MISNREEAEQVSTAGTGHGWGESLPPYSFPQEKTNIRDFTFLPVIAKDILLL